jgi:AcrR family transcriptional regulator
MPSRATDTEQRPSRPRRMSPEARRRQIIDTMRELLLSRPGQPISTADVALAAGVTRALVHHYFRGIEELRQAVAVDIADDTPRILSRGIETPVAERVRHNTAAMLDVVEHNRHVWLAAVAADGGVPASTPAADHMRTIVLAQMISNHADVISDTPWTRLCLTGYLGFSEMLCRQWVLGLADRVNVERALVQTLLRLLTEVIPEGTDEDRDEREGGGRG